MNLKKYTKIITDQFSKNSVKIKAENLIKKNNRT